MVKKSLQIAGLVLSFKIIKFWLGGDIIIPDLRFLLISIPGIVIAVTIHEYIKSLVAHKLGDKGIRGQKRLAPNPLRHIDPLGGLLMLFFGYGWANPVRLSVFPPSVRKKAAVIIFLMPFLVNVLLGAAFAIARRLVINHFVPLPGTDLQTLAIVSQILRQAAIFNISFAFFNILPIHPMDGMHLISGFSPMTGMKIALREKILQLFVVFAIVMGFAAMVFDPAVAAFLNIVTQ